MEQPHIFARACGSPVPRYTAPSRSPTRAIAMSPGITSIPADSRQALLEFTVQPAPGTKQIVLNFNRVPDERLIVRTWKNDGAFDLHVLRAPRGVFVAVGDATEITVQIVPANSPFAKLDKPGSTPVELAGVEPPYLAGLEMEMFERGPTGSETARVALFERAQPRSVATAGVPAQATPLTPAPLQQTASRKASASGRPAVEPSQVSAVAGPVDVKRWGALAGLIGSVWKTKFEVYTIDWDRPGEAIRIGVDGLFGKEERLIVADADGKSLRYVRSKPATGLRDDQRVVVERGKFALLATATSVTVCTPVSKGAALSCTDRRKIREKQPEPVWTLSRTDAAGGLAFLAALPGRFPGRPAGRFDPQFGVLAEMADRRWTEDSKPTPGSYPELFEFGRTAQGPALIARIRGQFSIARVAYLQASGSGPLAGTFYAGTVDSPNAMSSVRLLVDNEGSASICSSPGCDQWRMSRDGKLALRLRSENGEWTPTIFRPIPPYVATRVVLFDDLHNKTFLAPSGRTLSFTASPGSFIITKSWARGERQSTTCYTTGDGRLADCVSSSGSTRKGLPFLRNETGFALDGANYAVRGKNLVMRTDGSAEETIFNQSSTGLVELEWHSDEDRRDQIRLRRENRIQTAERARREREMVGAIMGAAQAIGGALAGNPASSGYTPSYRGGSSGISQPSGYSGMGTSSYTPMPPASSAYLQQQDELERFKIREQLYGSSGTGSSGNGRAAGSPAQPYSKAYEQLARDRAATDVQRAEVRAQTDASRAEEARTFAASPAANPGAGSPAISQPGASVAKDRGPVPSASTPTATRAGSREGGIIVKPIDDDWDRREAQRKADNASEKEARLRRETAEANRLAAERATAKKYEQDLAKREAESKARRAACAAGNCPPAKAVPR